MSGKAFFFLVLAALALGVLAGGAMIAVLAPDDSDTQDISDIVAIPGPGSAGGRRAPLPARATSRLWRRESAPARSIRRRWRRCDRGSRGRRGESAATRPQAMAALCERPASAAAWWESSTHWRMAPLC